MTDTDLQPRAPEPDMPMSVDRLDQASDDHLRALIAKAQTLLAAREDTRKREAITRIKALAKAHGLDVAIEPTKRRRGRKPKLEG